jgi:hypothetical protein
VPLLIIGGIVGSAALVAFFRRGQQATATKASCNSAAAAQAVAGQAAGGAAAGAAVGGVGAGIGAGVATGLALAQISQSPCGQQWIKHAGQQIHAIGQNACAKAQNILNALKAHGVAQPIGWDHMSCDQKLAAVAALASPLGLLVAGTDELVSTAQAAANTVANDAKQAEKKAESTAKSVVKKVFG